VVANGRSEGVIGSGYKKTSFEAGKILPDAPAGSWRGSFLAGKTTVKPTQSGDPMVTFTFRLEVANEEENEASVPTQLPARFILASDKGSSLPAFAKRNTKLELRALAAQLGFDLDIIPTEIVTDEIAEMSPEDANEAIRAALQPFIDAVEGQEADAWTTLRDDKRNPGQKQVDLHFSKPGSAYGKGGSVASRDEDEE